MSEGKKNGPRLMCPSLIEVEGSWKCRITRERACVELDGVRVKSLDFWGHNPCRVYECLLVQFYIQTTPNVVDWEHYAKTGKRYKLLETVEADSLEDK